MLPTRLPVEMSMHIDEGGRNQQSVRVNLPGARPGYLSYQGDPPVPCDIRLERRPT